MWGIYGYNWSIFCPHACVFFLRDLASSATIGWEGGWGFDIVLRSPLIHVTCFASEGTRVVYGSQVRFTVLLLASICN